ncbi:MAG: ABC-ATPase domain-containing protein [Oscillospiraceae bacterium]|nr:ABC-ATPase domain-containing protein [Oscillospiraceae bacterium]
MNRLNKIMNTGMENTTKTYREMYDGKISYHIVGKIEAEFDNDPTYWHRDNEISYTIERTHKLALDRPSVTLAIPAEKLGIEAFTPAAADFALRSLKKHIDDLNTPFNSRHPDYETGRFYIYEPGGEILPRNGAYFAMRESRSHIGAGPLVTFLESPQPPCMCLNFLLQVQLPRGKLKQAKIMLLRDLPLMVDNFLAWFDVVALWRVLELERKQNEIREWLRGGEYSSFIANGSILAREKGTALPMKNAIPFISPPDDELEVAGVRGMAWRRGVTVITGGGYSGKSTLLDALAAGIYNHAEGDGRELCITDDTAVTITAEDGRSVKDVNISPFLQWLPGGDPKRFSTERASGSTSQAANIMEAVDCGSRLLLIDEDRSATNFMIRDSLMRRLIEKEPLTPFTDRVCELFTECGVSSALVIGGSGEYISVANRIYMMDDFILRDVTERARALVPPRPADDLPPPADWSSRRLLRAEGFSSFPEGGRTERLEVTDSGFIFIGDEMIDVRSLFDIASEAQICALAFMLRRLEREESEQKFDLHERLDAMYEELEREGVELLYTSFFTTCKRFLELPRRLELMAIVNRMRRVSFDATREAG